MCSCSDKFNRIIRKTKDFHMNKTIAAHIFCSMLMLSWSGASFGMEVKRFIPMEESTHIPEGNLFVFSRFHKLYKVINEGDASFPRFVENLHFDRANAIAARIGGPDDNGEFELEYSAYIKTIIPVAHISDNSLRTLRYSSNPYAMYRGRVFARDNKGRDYLILDHKMKVTVFKPKIATVISTYTQGAPNQVVHDNAIMCFRNADMNPPLEEMRAEEIHYQKKSRSSGNVESVTKKFSNMTLTISDDQLEEIRKRAKRGFFLKITSDYSSKTTIFNIRAVKGTEYISNYNLSDTDFQEKKSEERTNAYLAERASGQVAESNVSTRSPVILPSSVNDAFLLSHQAFTRWIFSKE